MLKMSVFDGQFGRFILFCVALTTLPLSPLAASSPAARRNPLYSVWAGETDGKSGQLQSQPVPDGDGPRLVNIHDGDYAVYKSFDFDSGVAGFKGSVASTTGGLIEIRLDKPDGPLLGQCSIKATGGLDRFKNVACKVDNAQAGARDVYLCFHGQGAAAIMAVESFVFVKAAPGNGPPADVSGRVDVVDNEPQAVNAWGMPEAGFTDDFTGDLSKNWKQTGFAPSGQSIGQNHAVTASGDAFGYTPDVYINKTDTGGEWRTLAEASLAVDIVIDSPDARPGIGFTSVDGKQSMYVTMDAADHVLQAFARFKDQPAMSVRNHPKTPNDPKRTFSIEVGKTYRLQLDWSPYSNAVIVFLSDADGKILTSFRTVIDLPAARRPLLINSGGAARFAHVVFDPHLDGWNYRWQWKKTPILSNDTCNPAVWKWSDGKYYMVWRRFGSDTFHGVSSSSDAIHWTVLNEKVMKCTGDMNVLINPFGDGLVYITPGGGKLAWYTSDGSDQFKTWTKSDKSVGNIFGNSRIQEVIDTSIYKQLAPIEFDGKKYRFIAFTENWTALPRPHTVVLLSNTLTDWVLAGPNPLVPPRDDFWGEKGTAVGSGTVLPDGNIMIACCACTNEGYTGAPEPSNVTAIVDGKQPWKLLKLGILPDAPVSRENIWYQGPNFGTAYLYEPSNDTLYYYGGFHDSYIGMMRAVGVHKATAQPSAK